MESISIIEHTLENHTGFRGEHTIEFAPEIPSVIFGINGAGKTSLLDSIYLTLTSIINSITGIDKDQSLPINNSTISLGEVYSTYRSNLLAINETQQKAFDYGYKYHINGQIEDQGNFAKLSYELRTRYVLGGVSVPIFRYFKTNKLIDIKQTIITNQKVNSIEDRKVGYVNHNSEYLSIQEVTNFIINQINIENQLKIDKADLAYESPKAVYIRNVLNQFTTVLYGNSVTVRVGASKYSSGQSLVIQKESEELEFLQLSSGEKYVFAMVLELIYRNCILNSNVDDLHVSPGIVLIDEIESHLHPKWQLTILKALEAAFPNVQFIVSSHSPLIATSVKNEQIVVLNDFEVIPNSEIPNIYSGTADEALDKILFSDNQPPLFLSEKKEIDRLLQSFEYEDAEKKLNALKEKVGANPRWIKDYERTISFNRV